MISERKFATSFTSFWRELLPMGDAFLRRTNLTKSRFKDPLQRVTRPERRALVNELGFRLLGGAVHDGKIVEDDLPEELVDKLAYQAAEYISSLRNPTGEIIPVPDKVERREAFTIFGRLKGFFQSPSVNDALLVSPVFNGCGIVQQCKADVLYGETLYEVKAGERDFRLVDVRQLIVYCALNHVVPNYTIKKVGVVNPRLGVFFRIDIDELVESMTGTSAVELFEEITAFLSNDRQSG